jgi:tripartite-type tricarboxylate transporter receptor subunit TctC
MRNFRWLVVPPLSRGMTVACVAAAVAFGQAAHAQSDYPNRPITLVLPLGAGGAMDILARGQFAPKLSERLGKPIVVENRTGGGTVIAATSVAKSPPDGYTLFFVPAGTLTTNATLYKNLPYDPGKDFVPIALTSKLGFVLSVHPSTPVKSIPELVAYVKERPGQLSYGSTGIGATPHLAVEMFQRAAGLQMTHVPYRGMPQATNDVVAGHTQMVFTDPPLAQSLSADNKLRPLAVSTLERIPAVPAVPSLHELGFKDFEAVSWHMIVAPAGTPKPVVDRLHAEFKAIVASPEFQQQALKMGLNAIDSPPPEALKRYLDAEILRWGELVKQVGIAGTQ